MDIKYCPTEDMLGNQFIKPQSGSLFQKMRNMTLGIKQTLIPFYNEE